MRADFDKIRPKSIKITGQFFYQVTRVFSFSIFFDPDHHRTPHRRTGFDQRFYNYAIKNIKNCITIQKNKVANVE